jgi:hypothetical protein
MQYQSYVTDPQEQVRLISDLKCSIVSCRQSYTAYAIECDKVDNLKNKLREYGIVHTVDIGDIRRLDESNKAIIARITALSGRMMTKCGSASCKPRFIDATCYDMCILCKTCDSLRSVTVMTGIETMLDIIREEDRRMDYVIEMISKLQRDKYSNVRNHITWLEFMEKVHHMYTVRMNLLYKYYTWLLMVRDAKIFINSYMSTYLKVLSALDGMIDGEDNEILINTNMTYLNKTPPDADDHKRIVADMFIDLNKMDKLRNEVINHRNRLPVAMASYTQRRHVEYDLTYTMNEANVTEWIKITNGITHRYDNKQHVKF